MEFPAMLDLALKFLWPPVLAYVVWLHNQLVVLQNEIMNFKVKSAQEYATQNSVMAIENKLTVVLNRIDDKVTRILERREN